MENNIFKEAEDFITAEQLRLAAANLQYLRKLKKEKLTMTALADALEQSIADANDENPIGMCDKMIVQATLLDAAFHYFLTESKGRIKEEDIILNAVKIQSHMVRTMLAWKKIKTSTYIKHKIMKQIPELEKMRGTD